MEYGPYHKEAAAFITAIKDLAANPGAMERLEYYLAYHFDYWLDRLHESPWKAACEMRRWSALHLSSQNGIRKKESKPAVEPKQQEDKPAAKQTLCKKDIICLVGPSGSGKTAIKNALLNTGKYVTTISVTTREPRPGEVDGKDYHFVSEDDVFDSSEPFLEGVIYHKQFYGTPLSAVKNALETGKKVVMVVDINGALAIKHEFGDRVAIGFVMREKNKSFESIKSRGATGLYDRMDTWTAEHDVAVRYCDFLIGNNNSLQEAVKFVMDYVNNQDYLYLASIA